MVSYQKINQIKLDALELCINAGAGHVTSAFSCAEIVGVLYYDILNIDPQNPSWEDRDRFVMSKNHASVITYPILADLGYVSKESVKTFLQDGSIFGAHTKMSIPGVDFAGGSLGIGIGVACGMAYSAKQDEKDWITYCILGDGECYEGSVWEAAMFAGNYELDNLVVFLDRNNMCVTNFTEKMVRLNPLREKWESFGWDVKEINGHSIEEIHGVLDGIKNRKSKKPLCVISNTTKGNGIPFMENNIFMHGVAPKEERAEEARKALREAMNEI